MTWTCLGITATFGCAPLQYFSHVVPIGPRPSSFPAVLLIRPFTSHPASRKAKACRGLCFRVVIIILSEGYMRVSETILFICVRHGGPRKSQKRKRISRWKRYQMCFNYQEASLHQIQLYPHISPEQQPLGHVLYHFLPPPHITYNSTEPIMTKHEIERKEKPNMKMVPKSLSLTTKSSHPSAGINEVP